jgi:protein-S-isoprenylcysteine O-methyltransferase Ste14
MLETLAHPWSPTTLFALRHMLFLGPLALCVLLFHQRRDNKRLLVGAVFAFLYGLPLVFVSHMAACQLGLWTYGGTTLHVLGVPADIWFGGTLLWGPVVFLAAPAAPQWWAPAAFVAINGITLPALTPFVTPGRFWFAGVVIVFLIAHLPALYLAQWTWLGKHLPRRAFLLACAFAPLAFFVVPTLIMHALGGRWEDMAARPAWALALAGIALAGVATLGWSGVQMFVLYGDGTPIPLDPTRRLVTSGVYAYVSNPMQLSTAIGFAILGATLWNGWVFGGAVMTVAFVLGMVRWHHRNDLALRFPVGWPMYRTHVPEWVPRWKPWRPTSATFIFDPARPMQAFAAKTLGALRPVGLSLDGAPGARLLYRDEQEFGEAPAFAMALTHTNFVAMMVGSAMLLILLPIRYAMANRGR